MITNNLPMAATHQLDADDMEACVPLRILAKRQSLEMSTTYDKQSSFEYLVEWKEYP